jgi:hypothetical protein
MINLSARDCFCRCPVDPIDQLSDAALNVLSQGIIFPGFTEQGFGHVHQRNNG